MSRSWFSPCQIKKPLEDVFQLLIYLFAFHLKKRTDKIKRQVMYQNCDKGRLRFLFDLTRITEWITANKLTLIKSKIELMLML